jgi:hypothetical protein
MHSITGEQDCCLGIFLLWPARRHFGRFSSFLMRW